MNIPKLNPVKRDREYNSYSQKQIDNVIYNYLFNRVSHRTLDKDVLKLDVEYSKGWQSMGILHHVGLTDNFKNIFNKMSIDEAINILSELNDIAYREIIDSLLRINYKEIKYGVFNSWQIMNSNIAIKTTDKSVFEHHGSGIPKDTKNFWGLANLTSDEKKYIKLVYKNNEFEAYFQQENNEPYRTRLFWYVDFQTILKSKFPDYKQYENVSDMYPLIRFEKMDNEVYKIMFIVPKYVDIDVSIDDEENKTPVSNYEGKKEGQILYTYSKKYERSLNNRLEAIKIHGTKCVCCGFDFEKVYGVRGTGFIEIHHNKPLHSIDEEIVINPETDLSPVCSNCHRIIHRRKDDVLSVEQVKALIQDNVII